VDCADSQRDAEILIYFTAMFWRQLSACLFSRQVADEWQLELLIVVGLDHQENPAAKHGQPDKRKKQPEHAQHTQPTAGKEHANKDLTPNHPEGEACQPKKDGLECMETHKSIVFVGVNHQENYACDNAKNVAQ
jgi:hypothetical protein